MRTASNGKKVYSVDMMFAYIRLKKLRAIKLPISSIQFDTSAKCWPHGKTEISPDQVLKNPKKYAVDYSRIENADLRFPIIMNSGYIYDGVHRFIKAKRDNRKFIAVYEFDNRLLERFLINKTGDFEPQLEIHDYIELFNKKFP